MKRKFFDVDTELTFGIHKESTIEDVFDVDCQYLVWMYETFENVDWSDDAEVLVTRAMDILADDRRMDDYDSAEYYGNSPHDFF